MLKLVLFDLDGTLMDTAPEIADALNRTLMRMACPPVDLPLVRGWIGDGAQALLQRALAHVQAPPLAAAQAWRYFQVDYADACGSNSRVHDGVRPLLRRLREQGVQLALLTNKEAAFAHRLLALHDLASEFDVIVAGDTLAVKKPHADVVNHVLQALGVAADEALLVGDSITDVRTARNAGIAAWMVTHGYPQGELSGDDAPDGFIDHFDHFNPLTAPRVVIA